MRPDPGTGPGAGPAVGGRRGGTGGPGAHGGPGPARAGCGLQDDRAKGDRGDQESAREQAKRPGVPGIGGYDRPPSARGPGGGGALQDGRHPGHHGHRGPPANRRGDRLPGGHSGEGQRGGHRVGPGAHERSGPGRSDRRDFCFRSRLTRPQVPHRRVAAAPGARGGDDRRWSERCPGVGGIGDRHCHGRYRDGRDQRDGGHGADGRQLCEHCQCRRRGAGRLSKCAQSGQVPDRHQHRRRPDHPGFTAALSRRAIDHHPRPSPLGEPGYRWAPGHHPGPGATGSGRDASATATTQGADHRPRDHSQHAVRERPYGTGYTVHVHARERYWQSALCADPGLHHYGHVPGL